MNRLIALAALALSLLPAAARAQADINIHLGLPAVPPLVVVQPGIQVVENYDEEVFYSGGWYWVRRDDRWWRARQPRQTFVYVQPERVPPGLMRMPPGHYRHWRHEQAKADRREWKEREKADRREWKERKKAERREWKEDRGGGHGHGRGHGDD